MINICRQEIDGEEIADKTHQEQANLILDSILKVNNSYDPLKTENISIPTTDETNIPHLSEKEVEYYIRNVKTKPSTPPGNINAKIVQKFPQYFCKPLAHIVNECIKRGEWPDIWKIEAITPVPKVNNPKTMDKLRPISDLKLFNKISEKIISDIMIKDMKDKIDPSPPQCSPFLSAPFPYLYPCNCTL